MSVSYKSYSQSSRSPSGSSNGSDYAQYPTGSGQAQPSYYYPSQAGSPGEYSQYQGCSYAARPASSNSQRRTSSESIPRAATYPPCSADSERASKRQRSTNTGGYGADMQPAWVDPRYLAPAQSPHAAAYPSGAYPHSQSGSLSPPAARSDRRTPSSSRHHPSSERSASPPEGQCEPLDHGPTELPPRTYTGQSKYNPPKKPGKIPGSAMDYLPILEARFDRLETAIDRYVDFRGQRALSNSILPGSQVPQQSSSRNHNGGSTR